MTGAGARIFGGFDMEEPDGESVYFSGSAWYTLSLGFVFTTVAVSLFFADCLVDNAPIFF